MQPLNKQVLAAVTNTGTVVSEAIDARFLLSATAQAFFSDVAAAGSLKLQGSNDAPLPGKLPIHWNDIPNTTVAVAAGATATTPPLSAYLCYQFIRVVFVSSGGAGTITANLHAFGG